MVGPEGLHRDRFEDGPAPGGTYHYGMKAPDGTPMWGKMVLPRDRRPRNGSCSSTRSPTRPAAPRAIRCRTTWPLEMLSIFTFEDLPAARPRFTVRWCRTTRAAEERKTFDTNHDSMRQGWGGTLDKLDGLSGQGRRTPHRRTRKRSWRTSMDSSCPCRRRAWPAYRRMAKKAGKVWREHGALEYRECVADDVKVGQVDVVPAQRQAQARRDRRVLVDRLQVARASRPRQRQGDEGPAPRQDDERRRRCPSTASA